MFFSTATQNLLLVSVRKLWVGVFLWDVLGKIQVGLFDGRMQGLLFWSMFRSTGLLTHLQLFIGQK